MELTNADDNKASKIKKWLKPLYRPIFIREQIHKTNHKGEKHPEQIAEPSLVLNGDNRNHASF